MRFVLPLAVLLLFLVAGCSGPRPGAIALDVMGSPERVLPGLVSTDGSEIRLAVHPDGDRMLWGMIGADDGPGGWEILEAIRTETGWSPPRPVPFNTAANDFSPTFAPDGRSVYFYSNRPGGQGGDDLYVASFDPATGSYGPARNLGPTINTPGNEWSPVLSPDGTRLLFASDGHGGYGLHDLLVARRTDDGWTAPENLGSAVNTDAEEFDAAFLPDGATLVFTSGRFTEAMQLYRTTRQRGEYTRRERLALPLDTTDAWTLGPSTDPSTPGVLYVTVQRFGAGSGLADIYRLEYERVAPE
jgi:hypothetical protein